MNAKVVVFFALLLLLPQVLAQSIVPAVVIEPVQGTSPLELYPLEVREYRLKVVNLSNAPIENVDVVLSVPEELAFVVDGADKSERFYSFLVLPPNAIEERIFLVKALEESSVPLRISASYGAGDAANSSSTSVLINGGGVDFTSRLGNASLEPNARASAFFSLANNSDGRITNIRAELIPGTGEFVQVTSPAFEQAFLDPGQNVPETEFGFVLGPGTGERVIVMRLFFTDSSGAHVLEKSYSLDVQYRDVYVLLLVAAILALVVVSLYMRRKKPGQQTEGIKVEASVKVEKTH
ncbi:MAG: hypothetical protein NUV67_03510 [archaeon]|nr:hypothetical protein [archaeon]